MTNICGFGQYIPQNTFSVRECKKLWTSTAALFHNCPLIQVIVCKALIIGQFPEF